MKLCLLKAVPNYSYSSCGLIFVLKYFLVLARVNHPNNIAQKHA